MLVKAILLAIWAGLCALDQYGPQLGFRKPLLAGLGAGIILGDVTQGLIIGGTLEIMWLGMNNVGAYIPPDVISGSIVGVTVGITSGGGLSAAVAIAVPVAMVVQQLDMLWNTAAIGLVHKADKDAESGDFSKIDRDHLLGVPFVFLTRAIPVFVAAYLGGSVASDLLSAIPENILTGLGVASKIIPAVGVAMLLTMMLKSNMWIFLILGFVFGAYFQLSILGTALIGICFAGLYDLILSRKAEVASESEERIVTNNEEWDL